MSSLSYESILAAASDYIQSKFPWIKQRTVWIDPNNKKEYTCFSGKDTWTQTEYCIRALKFDPYHGLYPEGDFKVIWDLCIVRPEWWSSTGQPYWVLPTNGELNNTRDKGDSVEEILNQALPTQELADVFSNLRSKGVYTWQETAHSWIMPVSLVEPIRILRLSRAITLDKDGDAIVKFSWKAFMIETPPDMFFFRSDGLDLSPVIKFIKGTRMSFPSTDNEDMNELETLDHHTGEELRIPDRIYIREHEIELSPICSERDIQARRFVQGARRTVTMTPANSLEHRPSPLRDMVMSDADEDEKDAMWCD